MRICALLIYACVQGVARNNPCPNKNNNESIVSKTMGGMLDVQEVGRAIWYQSLYEGQGKVEGGLHSAGWGDQQLHCK
jgi:hypothetical protein